MFRKLIILIEISKTAISQNSREMPQQILGPLVVLIQCIPNSIKALSLLTALNTALNY